MIELDLLEILKSVDPTKLSYEEWVHVGMALKHEGYTAYDWDVWSSLDGARYNSGECFKKWDSFKEESGAIVTGGTIVQYAREQGFTFPNEGGGHALDWDSEISQDELIVVDMDWLEDKEIDEPGSNWDPIQDLRKYLETLFESTEHVGYVTTTYQDQDGKFLPTKGNYDRSAGRLIEELGKFNEIGAVFGDYKKEAGAWIRFNPLDGKGVKNENVTDYRYALVESDTVAVEKQNAIIRELELPVAALVYSGGKSVHAIVKIEAGSYEEYRKRVNYLYDVCKKNGLVIDTQNRNPSRLSRMPGIMRNGKKQFLMDTNIGKSTWAEWEEWIEGINDDLPDPEPLTDFWDNMPDLAPPLIEGVLRQGHKMLMAGPSKAGKSFALIGLSIAIAEGNKWFGWNCTQGRVLYVNLELDRASALHRFKDVYKELGLAPNNIKNIDIWNLRGKSVPMDKLAPKLIRRAQKRDYIAVIIDPIYKVITGDENSADQMAHFTNQFDKVANELGSSVIYCHHHSKGSQGGKNSMDRASGSGVFARDPDALIDLIELELTEDLIKAQENDALAKMYCEELKRMDPSYYSDEVTQDDELSASIMREHIHAALDGGQVVQIDKKYDETIEKVSHKSAWRVEGTLREYPKFPPLNLWFEYPIHKVDEVGVLKDVGPEGMNQWTPNKRNPKSNKQRIEEEMSVKITELDLVYEDIKSKKDEVNYSDLEEEMGVARNTLKKYMKEHGGFEVTQEPGKAAVIIRKTDDE